MSLLKIVDLEVFYGNAQALHGMSVNVQRGELLSLIGSNGAGKSTLFKSICGMVKPNSGSINFKGIDIHGKSPAHITELGVAMVPEGRRLFRSLSVEENLILGGYVNRARALGIWRKSTIYFQCLKNEGMLRRPRYRVGNNKWLPSGGR